MELYFLRHGIAANDSPDGSDASRPLTDEGIAKMRVEARGMQRLGIGLDVLLASPLLRARQTAEIVGAALQCDTQIADALTSGCDAARLLDLLRQHADAARVMVVGHEPDFSDMIGTLTGGSRVAVKKGALARVDLDSLDTGAGMLVWLIQPAALRALGQEHSRR